SPSTGLNTNIGSSVIALPSSSITYFVTGTSNGCSKTASVTVTVGALPSLVTSSNTSFCTGSSATLTASGANGYTWSPSAGLNTTFGNSVVAAPSVSTIYTVTGTSNGCSQSKSIVVDVNSSPNLSVSA